MSDVNDKVAAVDAESSEIKLSDEEIARAVEDLRQVVKSNDNLKTRTDDKFLLRFLYATNFNVDAAYKRMIDYYKLKIEFPHAFPQLPLSNYNEIIAKDVKGVLLDCHDIGGRVVHITKLGNINTSKVTFEDVVKCDDLIYEALIEHPQAYENGFCAILDMSGYSWKLFKWLTPNNIRAGTKKMETVALRNLQIHVVNSSMLLNAAVAIVFPFLSKQTKDHIHFHGSNWTSLSKFIHPKFLPEEYGGIRKVNYRETVEKLLEMNRDALEMSCKNCLLED